MGKKKNSIVEKYVTPTGELVGFVSIVKPSTKFNPEGVYQANILLSKKDGETLAEKIKAVRTEQFKTFGKGSKVAELTRCVPYTTVNDEGEEIPDKGERYILKSNAKAFIKDGKCGYKIPLYNAKVQQVQNVSIAEGSKVKLILSLEGYTVAGKTGVSVKLKGCQIIDLVEYTGSSDVAKLLTEEEGFDGVGEEFTEEEVIEETTTTEEADEEEVDF